MSNSQQEYHMINEDTLHSSNVVNDNHQEFFHNYLASSPSATANVTQPTAMNNNNNFQTQQRNSQTPLIMMMNNKAKSFDQGDLDRQRSQYHAAMDKKKELFFKNENIVQIFDKIYSNTDDNNIDDSLTGNNNNIITINHLPPQERVAMKYRNIGKNGLRVPILAFSAWNSFSHVSEDTAEKIITAALENGVNYFDTGDAFENGRAETLLGKVLKRRPWPRNSYIISTKIFWKTGPSAHMGAGLSRKFIIEAVEASLRRLQTKYIDIIIVHKLDAMCPMEELVRTMSYLINRGLIFYWGTSRFSTMHIAEAFSISRQYNCPPPICEQMEYHMFSRDKMELQMLELFHKAGIGCITWSPISLQNDEGISHITRRQQNKENQLKFNELQKLCDKLQCDLTQLALAWCLQNENVNCILVTATTVAELYQKLNSIKIYPVLTEMVNNEIEMIIENNPVIKRQHPKTPSITIDVVNVEPEFV
ncbi:aldo-keto reductase family 1-like protein [Dermatophagoides farinae]|uniref:Aldo-keto reductase family 1-like protein n=1 Tax=Dermatophagoides farinae TaxID=6954 RepID=A0A9D4P4S2_DERFA|nr:voltage-gated potassium channel subunit beta-2-like [Dermatophagoides farinae]KAH7643933.1 aldo-keto reductase family 1-like protein [Dermatophagoides farinae]